MSAVWPIRIAGEADIPAIRGLMERAIRELMPPFLNPAEIEASFAVMGLDTQLIADGTYFVIEDTSESAAKTSQIIGCGGWSARATLYGGDHTAGRSDTVLDPTSDAARIRAMYTDPAHARRGIGRAILQACEAAATAAGFKRFELMATLAGEPLYAACGYTALERVAATASGVRVPLVRMGKAARILA